MKTQSPIQEVASTEWVKIWAGTWSFLTCNHFAEEYTQTLRIAGVPFVSKTLIFIHEGKSSAYIPLADKNTFGNHLAHQMHAGKIKIPTLTKNFHTKVDEILTFIKRAEKKPITLGIYNEFWERVDVYYVPHITVKYLVDYLDEVTLKEHMHSLQEARVYAEPVFSRTEDFMKTLAEQVSKKTNYPSNLVLCFTKEEIRTYLSKGISPEKTVLLDRYAHAGFYYTNKSDALLSASDVTTLEELLTTQPESHTLKGATAYAGVARGIVRIIHDPTHYDTFNEGDILVAGMTRPEYLSLMKKAAAFVTDAGGLLCHAAIVARELKKPCIIGTQRATKQLKDGMRVEVNATQGTITILS